MSEAVIDPSRVDEVHERLAAWEAGGERIAVGEHEVWCRRFAAVTPSGRPTLLALHGFPTCSYDWVPILPALTAERDVVVVDALGFGLSDKPDLRYSMRGYADCVSAVAAHFGLGELDRVDLLTHDMGDSIGGEVLARSLEGTLGFTIGRRVLTNGSIYIDMAQLTVGQQLLLGLPDAVEPAVGADGGVNFRGGVSATFAADSVVDPYELDCLQVLAVRDDGLSRLPRTIRYIEDRRAEEARFTGAIETHPAPVDVIWGDQDPVAVHPMAQKLLERRPDARLVTLEGVGHYPMLEAPEAFSAAVLHFLDDPTDAPAAPTEQPT